MISTEEAATMFDFFSDKADQVPGSDVIAAVQKFRRNQPPSKMKEPDEVPSEKPKNEIPSVKPVIKKEKLTPEQETELVKRFKSTIAKRNLNFEHLFSMADPDDSGTVSVIGLRNVIRSQVPDFSSVDVFSLLRILDKNKNGAIDIEEYEAVMLTDKEDLKSISDNDSRVELRRSQLGSQKSIGNVSEVSAKSAKPKQPAPILKPGKPQPKIDSNKALGDVIKAFKDKEIDPVILFDWTDDEKEKVLPTMKLHRELSINLNLDKNTISAAVKYLDKDSIGYIKREDYVKYMNPSNLPKPEFVTDTVYGDEAQAIGSKIGNFKDRILDESFPKPESEKSEGKDKKKSFKIKGSNKTIAIPNPMESIKNSLKGSGAQTPVAKFTRKIDDSEFQSIVKEIKDALLQHNISALTIFDNIAIVDDPSFPEPPGTEKAATIKVLEAMTKALPGFDKFKLRSVLQYIDMEKAGIISREEFDLVFGVNPDTGALEDSRLTANVSTDSMKADIEAMFKELTKIHMIDTFFKDCDTDGDGVVNILDIKAALMLRLDEEKKDLIIPFIKHVKRLFKTDMIDENTLLKLFSTKFKSITDLRDYRTVMLKLRDMANDEKKKAWMNAILKQSDSNKDGKLSADELFESLTKMKLDIREDIKRMIADDIVYTHDGFTIDSFFSYLSSEVKDREAVNNIKYIGELISAQVNVQSKAGITSQALSVHLKSIKNSKLRLSRHSCCWFQT
jgi:Ca2+-binding EF-hand superfamily protein